MEPSEILNDLESRLVYAARILRDEADRDDVPTPESNRLRAKASGVSLALSYLKDYR